MRLSRIRFVPKVTRELWTIVWVGYFFAKAGVYVWLAASPISFERLLVVRAVIGNVSLYALLAASIFGGKPAFFVLRRWRLLPSTRSGALQSVPTAQTPA